MVVQNTFRENRLGLLVLAADGYTYVTYPKVVQLSPPKHWGPTKAMLRSTKVNLWGADQSYLAHCKATKKLLSLRRNEPHASILCQ